ncbi:outer membrane protein [Burkholderiales bacterium GJ-E10]|nr:outer membrane protein [Burkholderiales bacterium GJ-E10]
MNRALLIALASMLAAAACTTVKPLPASTAAPAPAAQPAPAASAAPAPSPEQVFQQKAQGLDANQSVYFAFDRYNIQSDQTAAIRNHANLAIAYPNDHITIQGNCDERGSAEYNLALGQHRADAVKQALVAEGVSASRIDTVSFGKSKPRALCHAERCWKENRRADFVDAWQ